MRGRSARRSSTTTGDNLDPQRIWAAHDGEREAGRPRRALGRGRRARHGGLGRGREDRGQAALPAARRALQRRRRSTTRSSSTRPAATTIRARTSSALQDEMRSYLDLGYTVGQDEDRRRARSTRICARIEAVLEVVGPARAASRSMPTAASTSTPRSPTRRRSRPTACSGTRKPATRSTTSCRPSSRGTTTAPMATGENLFSMQDARNLIRYGGMRPRPRLAAVRLRALATASSSTCARWRC